MPLIEGIGDELVVCFVVLVALLVLGAAWASTFVSDPPEIAQHVTPSGVVSQNLDFPGNSDLACSLVYLFACLFACLLASPRHAQRRHIVEPRLPW